MGNTATASLPANVPASSVLTELDELVALRKMAAVETELLIEDERQERIAAGYPIPPAFDTLLCALFAELVCQVRAKKLRATALGSVHKQLRLQFAHGGDCASHLTKKPRAVVLPRNLNGALVAAAAARAARHRVRRMPRPRLSAPSPSPMHATTPDGTAGVRETLALVREYIERRGAVAAAVAATTSEQSSRTVRAYFTDRVGRQLEAAAHRRAAARAAAERRTELVATLNMTDVLGDIERRGHRQNATTACYEEQALRVQQLQQSPPAAQPVFVTPLLRAQVLSAVRRVGVRQQHRHEAALVRHQFATRTQVLPQLTAAVARGVASAAAATEQAQQVAVAKMNDSLEDVARLQGQRNARVAADLERRRRLLHRQHDHAPPVGLPLVHDQLCARHDRRATAALVEIEVARAQFDIKWQAINAAVECRAARRYAAAACLAEQQTRVNRNKLAQVMTELHEHCIRVILAHATAQARRDQLIAFSCLPFSQRAVHAVAWALVPV